MTTFLLWTIAFTATFAVGFLLGWLYADWPLISGLIEEKRREWINQPEPDDE